MLGITPPKSDGRDLSPLLDDQPIEDTPVYLESVLAQQRFGYHPEIATVHQGWKLIDTPSAHLLHLQEDPSEENNLFVQDHTNLAPFAPLVKNLEHRRNQVSSTTIYRCPSSTCCTWIYVQ